MLAVARRPGVTVDLDHVLAQVPDARGRVEIVDVPLIDIASRDLRRRVRTGEPITYQVPSSVERYIREHRLYQRA
jgi:nicotinate-nucleotide adenylyltransferase